jgi:hypothetical protein
MIPESRLSPGLKMVMQMENIPVTILVIPDINVSDRLKQLYDALLSDTTVETAPEKVGSVAAR